MGSWKDQLPAIGMISTQFLYAGVALLNRAALVQGMNPRIFIFYRQTIATLVICPIAYLTRGRSSTSSMGLKSLMLVFITALIGVALNQNMYFEGLYLASSSIASATANLIPAVTFVIAAAMGLEQVNLKTLSSAAKILGTAFCVGGAISMALLRGPKLLNAQLSSTPNSLLQQLVGVDNAWLLGCLCLFASSCCWSIWLILQVPLTNRYPDDHLSLSGWMCFLSMLQSGAIALFFERDPAAWNFSSHLELTCIFFSGIFGSGVQFFIQSWCISRRGPFFSAMFTPLATVITTVLACIILHEKIYLGSLLGAIAVIIGLYVVIWGKAEELKQILLESTTSVKIAQEKISDKIDLEQPLLTN